MVSRKSFAPEVCDLGLISWREAMQAQEAVLAAKLRDRESPDVLFLLEHPLCFTLGRRGGRQFFIRSEAELRDLGVEVIACDRGGLVSCHAPGQLVVYPVFDLFKRKLGVKAWVEQLERAMLGCVSEMGLKNAYFKEDARGVWVEGRKIGSIGLSIRRGLSLHGFSLNICPDLEPFSWIQSCGLAAENTSLLQELGGQADERSKSEMIQQGKKALLKYLL